jgi:hypothetical protein
VKTTGCWNPRQYCSCIPEGNGCIVRLTNRLFESDMAGCNNSSIALNTLPFNSLRLIVRCCTNQHHQEKNRENSPFKGISFELVFDF